MKTAVITGTTRGLGKAIAEDLLSKGWYVLGLSRTEGTIENPNYIHKVMDIRDTGSINHLIGGLECTIDLLIHNAAVFKKSPIWEMENEEINSIIDTNLKGPINLSKAAEHKISENGRIIFINSVAGLHNIPNQSVYCASKHGLTSFAKIIGQELKLKKIKVSSIHPGGMNTALWNESNPYPLGDSSQALNPVDVVTAVDYIVNSPANMEISTLELFPIVEWHG
jgi:3-oxoacyl-[acyl-carrier protein] reductase